jgi:hypothetical protein
MRQRSDSTQPAASDGGGGGDPTFQQLFNPGSGTTSRMLDGGDQSGAALTSSVTNGNTVCWVQTRRTTGTAVATAPSMINEVNAHDILMASTRYDTGGTSDGAAIFGSFDVSTVESYALNSNDAIYSVLHACVGLELSGVGSINSTALASYYIEANNSDPSVTIPASGETYDALLVCYAGSNEAFSDFAYDTTAEYTPSVTMTAYAGHHTDQTYESDAFIGVMPPMQGVFTLGLSVANFTNGGHLMRVYGITAA